MADGVNAFTVYSSLELQINEFVQQLNRASQILDQTLQNMSGAVSSLNMPAVEVRTEANTGAVHDVENAVNGINVPPVTVHTETEPLEQVTVPPPDDRTFLQKIRDGFNNLKNTINSIPSNIAGKFREMGTNIVSTFRSFPSDVASKFREMKNSAVERIKSLPSDIAGVITSVPSKIGSGLKTIGTNISNAFKSGVENAKNALKELPEKASEALKETGEKLKGIAEKVAKAGTVAIGAVSTGVTVGLKKSVDAGASFDKSMAQVAATMGKSVDEIADLRAFAQEMGRTTAFSATESADALNYMALAGYDAETSMSMLPNVLNLASAGGMDLALASDMITDSQTALGLSLDETTVLVDQMAKASSKSNTSVSQLGDAILTIGGTAKSLSGGTKELTQTLGILADNGIKASESGTHLRNILMAMKPSTEAAVNAWNSLGVEAYDSSGKMRKMSDVFTELNAAMSGMTDLERDIAIENMFNKTDVAAVKALLSTTTERWAELDAEIDASAGAANAMAKTQLDNLAGDVTLFKSALEGAQIAISDHLTPALRDFVKMGSNAMSEIAFAFESSDDLETAVFKMGRYLQGDIYKFVSKIVDAIPQVVSIATTIINSFGQAIVKNIPKLADSAVQLLKGFAENISKNAPTAIKGFSDMLKKVADWIKKNGKTLITAGMSMVKSIAKGISENLPDMIGSVTEIISFIGEMISENLDDLLDSGLEILESIGQGIFDNLPKLVGTAFDIVTSLGEYLIEKIPVLTEKAPEIVESLATALSECGDKMVTVADELITKFADAVGLNEQWEEIKTSVKGAIDNISASFDDMKKSLQPLKDAFDKLKDKIFGTKDETGLLKKGFDRLCDTVSKTIDVIGKAISGIMDFVTWLNSGTTGAYVLKTAIEAVATAISITLIGGAIKGLIAQLPVLLGYIVAQTSALIANAAAWIAATAPIVAIGAVLALIIYDIKQVIDNFDELKEFFPLVWNDFKKFLSDTRESLDEFLEPFIETWFSGWDSITGFFNERIDDLKTGWQSIINFFKERIDDLSVGIQSVKDFFASLRDHIHNIFGAIGRFISGLVDNWKSGVQSIKDGVENVIEKVKGIPDAFGELVDSALNWGRDLIENFMQGAKEKIEAWNSFWEEVGFTIYDILHHSTPEKGPLKDDDKWGGDLMDNLINGVKSKKKELSDTIKGVAENIKETFEKPVSVSTDITADGRFNRLKVPDISAVAENIYTVKSAPAESAMQKNSPVVVESLIINVEGKNLSSEYEMEKFINMVADRLQARNIIKSRGVGGVFS